MNLQKNFVTTRIWIEKHCATMHKQGVSTALSRGQPLCMMAVNIDDHQPKAACMLQLLDSTVRATFQPTQLLFVHVRNNKELAARW